MIKFIKKKHVHHEAGQIIIYYNITDIFLGIILLSLVFFFIHDYLSHALHTSDTYNGSYMNQVYKQSKMDAPVAKP